MQKTEMDRERLQRRQYGEDKGQDGDFDTPGQIDGRPMAEEDAQAARQTDPGGQGVKQQSHPILRRQIR